MPAVRNAGNPVKCIVTNELITKLKPLGESEHLKPRKGELAL